MRQYDPNPSVSVFAVVLGAVAGIALGVALGLGAPGVIVLMVVGILVAGFVASALGIVGERGGGPRERDDLPSEYQDYWTSLLFP